MLSAELIISHIQNTFTGMFTEARYRKPSEPFDLNALRGSDLILVPARLKTTTLGNRAVARTDGSVTVLDEYIGIFLLPKKVKSKLNTLQTLTSALVGIDKLAVEISRVEVDPAHILKGIFKKDQTVDVSLFAIWFNAQTLFTTVKTDCEICYDDC